MIKRRGKGGGTHGINEEAVNFFRMLFQMHGHALHQWGWRPDGPLLRTLDLLPFLISSIGLFFDHSASVGLLVQWHIARDELASRNLQFLG